MDYYQDDSERARKIKIIAIATAAAVVVLAIGAWIIIAAISSVNHTEETAAVEETTQETKSEETKNTDKTAGKTTAKVPEQTTTTPVVTEVDTKEENLPTTGPEDVLPLALLAGVMVALVTSGAMAKARA
ncbi:hypothetical protein IJG66_01360 [Candidatus Saccharibacteria bacterium]|nr:hypothetical protein [Candidatus Saccharibacteria bacterium]